VLEAAHRHVAPIAAVALALSVGVAGVAYGDSHPPTQGKVAKGKKSHKLSADYKTAPVSVIDEPSSTTVEFSDDAKLVGRPFGNLKAHLDEESLLTYNQPGGSSPRTDYSGSFHVTFKAVFYSDNASFRGFYDYSIDSNGDPSSPITGSITGGRGKFRGAKGSFQILNFAAFHPESVQYMGHWQGSIRY
jgi:hypothetical protein